MNFSGSKKYLIELIVIFVGITLSFWAENVRQDLEDKKLEKKYLQGLLVDLKKDLTEVERYRKERLGQIRGAQSNLRAFHGDLIEKDSFLINFVATSMEHHFLPHVNTYKEILNSGHLRLLTDDSLKAELLALMSLYDQLKNMDLHLQRDLYSFNYDKTFGTVDLEAAVRIFSGGQPNRSEAEVQTEVNELLKNKFLKNYFAAIFFTGLEVNENLLLPIEQKIRFLIDRIGESMTS